MKVILFDFFGVISTPVYMQVIRKFVPAEGQAKWVRALDELDLGDLPEAKLQEGISAETQVPVASIRDVASHAPEVDQELLEYIRELKSRFAVGLLTNIPRTLLEDILKDDLALFDPAIISSDVHLVKPDPRIFELAIARAGCDPSDILFIDDSERNIEIAAQCGMIAVRYEGLGALEKTIEALAPAP
ncbi:MAG: hypothetical protein RL681_638 [Candidatus Parcubacteria bacterium]|jgi:putative hydrolase of the HAD superfamily